MSDSAEDKNCKLVILHGWGSNSARWEEFRNIMKEKGVEVIVKDLPGFGTEKEPTRPFHLDDYLNWVEKNIFSQVKGDFCLLGHSFGGRLAIKYCGTRGGDRIKKLIIAAAPIRPSHRPWYIDLLLKISKKMSFLPFFDNLRIFFYKRVLKVEDYIKLKGVMKETFKNIISEDISGHLLNIDKPTLIVWGDKDKMVSPKLAFEMKEKIKNSKLVFIKDCGHTPYLTHNEEFTKIVYDFIKN